MYSMSKDTSSLNLCCNKNVFPLFIYALYIHVLLSLVAPPQLYDLDGNGKINREEMENVLNSMNRVSQHNWLAVSTIVIVPINIM